MREQWNRTVYFGESMELTRRTSSVKECQGGIPGDAVTVACTHNRRRGERVTTIKGIRHWRQVARRTDLSRAHVWGGTRPLCSRPRLRFGRENPARRPTY